MKAEASSLITPYGGQLVNLLESSQEIEKLKVFGENLPSIQISERLACDLELLATGAFSPLEGFMGQEDFQRVLDEMRLVSGCVFPMPITLPVSPSPDIQLDKQIALRSLKNDLLAVLTIEEIYEPFLIQQGYMERTPRGRMVTLKAREQFGGSQTTSPQSQLFKD